jgi:hypothetical protein
MPGRHTTQFPPNGFEIGDSFFIREIPVEEDPFRKYVGICASGTVSEDHAFLRTYAIILQDGLYTCPCRRNTRTSSIRTTP